MKHYDIIIVGAGASGVFLSYELTKLENRAKVLMIDKGAPLEKRQCPIKKGAKTCVKCSPCHIMNGYGGAGTLSDGKYNITTQFGGDLHNYVGRDAAMALMEYVDEVLCGMGGADAKLYSTASSELKTIALRNNLHLLEAKVRHLGTDRNVKILGRIFDYCSDRIDTMFYTTITESEQAVSYTHLDVYKRQAVTVTSGAEIDGVTTEFEEMELQAPVKKGDKVGVIKVYNGNELVSQTDVVAAETIEKGGPLSYIGIPDWLAVLIYIAAALILLMLLIIWLLRRRARKRRRRRKAAAARGSQYQAGQSYQRQQRSGTRPPVRPNQESQQPSSDRRARNAAKRKKRKSKGRVQR